MVGFADTKQIRIKDIKRYAESLLETLEGIRVTSLDELKANLRTVHHFGLGYIVEIDETKSILDNALRISYGVLNLGIPIEGRIDKQFDYVKVLLKSLDIVPGYAPDIKDTFGNRAQEIIILPSENTDSFEQMISEFQRLREL